MTAARWASDRIREILSAPLMWGSREAVELQILQLVETMLADSDPDTIARNPRIVLDRYVEFVRERFPDSGQLPLFMIISNDPEAKRLAEELRDFCASLQRKVEP